MKAILPEPGDFFSSSQQSIPTQPPSPPPCYDSENSTPSPALGKFLFGTALSPSQTHPGAGSSSQPSPPPPLRPDCAAQQPVHPFACDGSMDAALDTNVPTRPAARLRAGLCDESICAGGEAVGDRARGRGCGDGGLGEKAVFAAGGSMTRGLSLRGLSLTLSMPRRAAEILRRCSGRSGGGTSIEAAAAAAAAEAALAELSAARMGAVTQSPLPGWRIEPFASSTRSSSLASLSTHVPWGVDTSKCGDVANGRHEVEELGKEAEEDERCTEGGGGVLRPIYKTPNGPQAEEPAALLAPSPAWLAESCGDEAAGLAGRRFSALSGASTASVGGGASGDAAVAAWLVASRSSLSGGSGTTDGASGFILYPDE
jgi:hypothetical protein